ncbi:MAG: 3-deoxy-manno-octulosonate cytidylyltransferase [Candidatus Cloacimonadota bacterium]|nr:3-deoxy-manno-octulosonate cytidylyltransferase [Candidatus Cloacimonadota bacterium]
MNKIIVIIPARFASTRLPGKPLKKIGNRSLIQKIYESVAEMELFHKIIVVTDDERISKEVKNFGGEVFFSTQPHYSGTDRIAEVAEKIDAEIFINIQADEIFITKNPLEELITAFQKQETSVATLIHPLNAKDDIENPNQVKVVFDKNDFAIYFSRYPIPYNRNQENIQHWGHIGVYAFRKDALMQFATLPQSYLEKSEKLEQLRLLENGIKIRVVKTDYFSFGIDTPEDLERARKMLN